MSSGQQAISAFCVSMRGWAARYWVSRVGMTATLTLLALALLGADWLPWSAKGAYSDLAITHWPNALFIQTTLRETGRLPLWRPLIMAGTPFAANPLSGLWYPPNLLLLVLPLPSAFNLLLALHLLWSGLGMYRLGQQFHLSQGAACIAATAWVLAPRTIAHMGAGHVGLVYALGWWPWVVWAARRAREAGTGRAWGVAGGVLALEFLADPRITALTLPVAVLMALFTQGVTSPLAPPLRGEGSGRVGPSLLRSVGQVLPGALVFLLLTAVQTLPLAEFMGYSTRAWITPYEAGGFSLPWNYLLGIILPDRGGFHEWMTYVGPAVLILAILGLRALGRRAGWVLAGLGLAVLFALGANTPFYRLLVSIVPGLTWLRVPARAWFIVVFGLALLAGVGVHVLQRRARPGRRLSPSGVAALALALVVMDLGFMDVSLIRLRSVASVLAEGGELAATLAAQPGLFRVYSPSYSLPQQTGAMYGLQSVDGVDPLQLAETVAFVRQAAGLEDQPPRYSEVLPPAPPSGDVILGHRDARPDLNLLGLLNVRYLAAEFPLQVEGLMERGRFGTTILYENTRVLPRAFVLYRAEPVTGPEEALARLKEADPRQVAFVEGGAALTGQGTATLSEALVTTYTPDYVTVQATLERHGVLILSEVWYPGWEARVDGQPVPIYRADGLLRAVYLQPGTHTVEFSYDPWTVKAGLALSALGWLVFISVGMSEWRKQARSVPPVH